MIGKGDFKRYTVECECLTEHPLIRHIYSGPPFNGQPIECVSVFAYSVEDAHAAAIEKQKERWLRHQALGTDWRVLRARED